MFTIEELYKAYLDCRQHKRCKIEPLEFEMDFEERLSTLLDEINKRTYNPLPSKCFVILEPKPREVFAASFRDRIVHHLIYNEINPCIEKQLNENIFNCRKDKGVLYGVKTLQREMSEVSKNYTKDAWIIKCDLKNFFPSISKSKLYSLLIEYLSVHYNGEHFDDVVFLLEKIIFQDVKIECIKKGWLGLWKKIPYEKSMFNLSDDYGLAIGNLTSQLFANFYLMEFDKLAKGLFDCYGRYVDDFYCLVTDKAKVKNLPILRNYLTEKRGLSLHPNKVYIQHVSKGVKFLGYHIKFNRLHNADRTLAKAYKACEIYDSNILCQINSYLGFMRHCTEYKKSIKLLQKLPIGFWKDKHVHFNPLYVKKNKRK